MKPSKTFLKFYAIFLIFLAILIGMTVGVVWLDHQEGQSEEKVIPIRVGTNDPDHIAPGIEKTQTRLAEIDATLTATSITATALTPVP
ncbi:MAG: hypothetical protein HND46_02245 [Chloroflexi bacterium]|nr:hypothetical protein [Chloroflexota bacterium]NOG62215.1 hypothetical protein [Chloroflexota bacterium]